MDALFQKAFAHWLRGEFDEAEKVATLVAAAPADILSARAMGLIGWAAVGRLDYARALRLFRDAWQRCRACTGRDVAFESSLVHAIATYESQLLESGADPKYYGGCLPAAGKAIDTYRLLVVTVDAWRGTLAGDEARALELGASTEITDVADHWRVFGMASRAGVIHGLGHTTLAAAVSSAAFMSAMSLDWNVSPGESRYALLYLAERLAPRDLDRARACLSAFGRIGATLRAEYFSGRHPLHEALEAHSRGAVAAAAGEASAAESLGRAGRLFDSIGFRWRAAASRLLMGVSGGYNGAEYSAARSFIVRSFPRSHLARELGVFPRVRQLGGTDQPLSPAQLAVVQALCAGMSPRDIARHRGTSIGTVRNQLKEIYRRTGLHSIHAVVSAFYRDGDHRGPVALASRIEHA